jgi:1-acyl-sn-glycerol-3-phosphate acyltransferase
MVEQPGTTGEGSPQLDDWLDGAGEWFRDWGDKDWEREVLRSSRTRLNEFGVDAFGMSPSFIRKVIPVVRFFYRAYFRVKTNGLGELPSTRLMFVANHSGQIPIDGALIAAAVAVEGRPPRIVRSMVERWVPSLPFVSVFMARCGQVLGNPENSRRLLESEEAILVFPEGVRGISKLYKDRYKLQEFGAGFMRLAMETGTPIVPVAVIGAEEAIPAIYNWKGLARLLRIPSFPITPTFPWLLAAGLFPYPVRIRIRFGEPLIFSGDPDDEDEVIDAKVAKVKSCIEGMLDKGLAERRAFPLAFGRRRP